MVSPYFSRAIGVLIVTACFACNAENHGNSSSLNQQKPQPKATIETKATKSGRVFTRDKSNPKLGEAWRDENGSIWGDIVKKEDGSPRFMNHMDATEYCKSIGGELPSYEDFIKFREFMGAKSGKIEATGSIEGYSPQILPNLAYTVTYTKRSETVGHDFWSSSLPESDSQVAYYFDGLRGEISLLNRVAGPGWYQAVRCIVH